MTVNIPLPEPPSANRYWRHVNGVTKLSAEARAYRQEVMAIVLPTRLRVAGPLAVYLHWWRGRKSGDLDNRIKQVLDALAHAGVYGDDAQIVELHAYRFEDKLDPRVMVCIEERSA